MDGLWTGTRTRHATGSSGKCPFCDHEDEDALHALWFCPKFESIRDQVMPDHKRMVQAAPSALVLF
eukprot:6521991-Alexandrium_andersonii.AAC.1